MGSSRIAFANLRAEMARERVTIQRIAEVIGNSRVTTGNKLANVVPLTLEETARIERTFFPGKGLTYLFREILEPEERGKR